MAKEQEEQSTRGKPRHHEGEETVVAMLDDVNAEKLLAGLLTTAPDFFFGACSKDVCFVYNKISRLICRPRFLSSSENSTNCDWYLTYDITQLDSRCL